MDNWLCLSNDAVEPLRFHEKVRIAAAVAVSVLLMTTVGWVSARPIDPEMAVAFTTGGRSFWTLWPTLAVLSGVCGVVGAAIAGPRLPTAGVLAAGAGLAALALRGGSMQQVLGYVGNATTAGRHEVMLAMGLDMLLWTAVMVCTWIVTALAWGWLYGTGETAAGGAVSSDKTKEQNAAPAKVGWPALAVTVVVALFVIWSTISRTPVATIARGQVIASVAAGFYLGGMAGRYFTGIKGACWYALAVPAVGLIGYLLGYLQAGMGWAKGPLAAYALLATTPPHDLVRPLPIEYIAVGVVGVILGYWAGQQMVDGIEQE